MHSLWLNRQEGEDRIFGASYIVLDEKDDIATYTQNFAPGNEFTVDWHLGGILQDTLANLMGEAEGLTAERSTKEEQPCS